MGGKLSKTLVQRKSNFRGPAGTSTYDFNDWLFLIGKPISGETMLPLTILAQSNESNLISEAKTLSFSEPISGQSTWPFTIFNTKQF